MSKVVSDKTITLQHTGYVVKGTALLKLWGGGKGVIDLKPIHLDSIPDDLTKIEYNDNGFGCESILEVEIEIYEDYEGVLVSCSDVITVKLD